MRISLFNTMPVPQTMDAIERTLIAVARSGSYILGEIVDQFERQLSEYDGSRHAVAVNSGTDALAIALKALGVAPGDEVIVPDFTFFATAEAVASIGAVPVMVDVSANDFNISEEQIENAITPTTKAIIPVHLFGATCNLDGIVQLAEKYRLKVVQDAAQAFGAQYQDRGLGTYGDAVCYSFYPTKNLGAMGDGGAITFNDDDAAARARYLRNHGALRPYYHSEIGYNSRLDAMQAALLSVKLTAFADDEARRKAIADYYSQELGFLSAIRLQEARTGSLRNLYTIAVEERQSLMEELKQRNIESRVYYPHPLSSMPALQKMARHPTSQTSKLCGTVLSIPMHPRLTDDQIEHVVNAVRAATEHK